MTDLPARFGVRIAEPAVAKSADTVQNRVANLFRVVDAAKIADVPVG